MMARSTRFSKALPPHQGENQADCPVLETDGLIVLPTIGMIIPNWFLLVPKAHSLNFAEQPEKAWEEADEAVSKIAPLVGHQDYIIFEHGAVEENSAVGCGVDHAHLHVIFAEKNMIENIWNAMCHELATPPVQTDLSDIFRQLDRNAPYYFAWRNGKATVDATPQNIISQRLRRVVAIVANRPAEWDYRIHPFAQNIAQTCKNIADKALIAA